jgi:hypothetical protein
MRYDGINILEGSDINNLTVASGTSNPLNPETGQMFFRTDLSKMYIYNGTQWSELAVASSGAGAIPRVFSVTVTNSSYVATGATTLSTTGGYLKLTGADFAAGVTVFFGNTQATTVTFTSVEELRVQAPARPAGTYIIYVVSSTGATGLYVPGITYA